jgi:hypothetical protein
MQSGSQPSDDLALFISLSIGFLIAGVVYIIPSIMAFRRNHPNRWIMLVINLASAAPSSAGELHWFGPCEPLTAWGRRAAAANPVSTSSSTT